MLAVIVITSICLVLTFIMRKAAKILRNKGFYNFAHLIDGKCVNDDDLIRFLEDILHKENKSK